ncbi:MAG: hypothetical protein ACM3NQ_04295 [Bacteroidales bacterium]
MADVTYQPKVYREQGAARFVVASSGSLDVESGGEIDIESGGSLKIAGSSITATAAELNLSDNQVASVTWSITSTSGMAKQIVATLKDAAGTAMVGNQFVRLVLLGDSAGGSFAGSSVATLTTGEGSMTCKVSVPSSSQSLAYAITSTSGAMSLKWSDTGKTVAYLGAVLPNGSLSITTAAITTTS